MGGQRRAEEHTTRSARPLKAILSRVCSSSREPGDMGESLQLDGSPAATDILIACEPDPSQRGARKTATRPRARDRCFELYSTFVQEGQVPIQTAAQSRTDRAQGLSSRSMPLWRVRATHRERSQKLELQPVPAGGSRWAPESRRREQEAPSKSRLCRHKTNICLLQAASSYSEDRSKSCGETDTPDPEHLDEALISLPQKQSQPQLNQCPCRTVGRNRKHERTETD